jgi:hypothetical protein
MPAARLTAENVRSLQPRDGRARDVYFDKAKGAPPGFALRAYSADRDRRFRDRDHQFR